MCIRGFIFYKTLIRDLLCILIFLTKVIKSVYFVSITVVYLGNFTIFLAKISFWLLCQGYFVKFCLFPHKIHIFYVKCICVSSCYCIKCIFMPIVYLVSKYIYLLAFSSQMVKIYVICNVLHVYSQQNGFCSQRVTVYFVCGIFESNVFQFCCQPHIFACIMGFVDVQILCQHTCKITNVHFLWHYTKLLSM